jgi:hypothetical protein
MATFGSIDGEESATVTFQVATITIDRNSTLQEQEILCLGDPDTSNAIAAVVATAPGSTAWGLVTRPLGLSTTMQVSSVGGIVAVQQNSTAWQVQVGGYSTTVNVSSLAGPVIVRSSAADALGTVYQSTIGDLKATVAQNSTVWAVQVDGRMRAQNSTIGDLLASVQQNSTVWQTQTKIQDSSAVGFVGSTAAPVAGEQGLVVRQVGYSTTINVSSLAGPVIVRSSAADALGTVYQSTFGDFRATVHNSTIGDLLASVQQNSTVWQVQAKIQDSSGVAPNIVGTRPTTGAQGLAVRTVLNDLLSTCFSTIGNGSTSSTIVSSAASPLRIKVYAYSITSTAQAVNTLSFASSLANPIWTVQMQSISSGISGANLAVSPPAWLFATEANSPLVFKITGTTGSYHLSFSYFVEA